MRGNGTGGDIRTRGVLRKVLDGESLAGLWGLRVGAGRRCWELGWAASDWFHVAEGGLGRLAGLGLGWRYVGTGTY